MRRSILLAAAFLALGPSLAAAGGLSMESDTVPMIGMPGGVNPLTRGALYNTPPDVSFVDSYAAGGRGYRHRRVVLRVRS